MIKRSYLILFTFLGLLFMSACEELVSTKTEFFKFEVIRPSAFRAKDGKISLSSDNEDQIELIKWTRFEYPEEYFSRDEISPDSLESGLYIYNIMDINGENYIDSVYVMSLDTFTIKEYFPAYPGSWWKYSNGDSAYCSDDYIKKPIYRLEFVGYVGKRIYDSVYASVVYNLPISLEKRPLGVSGLVKDYGILTYTVWKIFCENSYLYDLTIPSTHNPMNFCTTFCHDTIIQISNTTFEKVKIIEKVSIAADNSWVNAYRYYYAKNIGIIRADHYKGQSGFVKEYEISDYYINSFE